MKGKIIPLIILAILILIAIRATANGQLLPVQQCQYPERPLVNGQCDNSDPCDPERIKIDGGQCVEEEPEPKPVETEEPKVKQQPLPTELPDTGPGK